MRETSEFSRMAIVNLAAVALLRQHKLLHHPPLIRLHCKPVNPIRQLLLPEVNAQQRLLLHLPGPAVHLPPEGVVDGDRELLLQVAAQLQGDGAAAGVGIQVEIIGFQRPVDQGSAAVPGPAAAAAGDLIAFADIIAMIVQVRTDGIFADANRVLIGRVSWRYMADVGLLAILMAFPVGQFIQVHTIGRAVAVGIQAVIAAGPLVAGVADAVTIGVGLIGVIQVGTVIKAIGHAIAVGVEAFVCNAVTVVVLSVASFGVTREVVGVGVVAIALPLCPSWEKVSPPGRKVNTVLGPLGNY